MQIGRDLDGRRKHADQHDAGRDQAPGSLLER
jgi:hypothetical protein